MAVASSRPHQPAQSVLAARILPVRGRVDPRHHAARDDEASVSLGSVRLGAEIVDRQFPRVQCARDIGVDDAEVGLDWGLFRVWTMSGDITIYLSIT